MEKIIGVGEYHLSDRHHEKIKTFALGSCVALVVYVPGRMILGMVHIALPDSSIDPQRGKIEPGYFADIAVPLMVNTFLKKYGVKPGELMIRLFGGARSVWEQDSFNIGARNIEAVTKILDKLGFRNYDCSETGGSFSRTVEADVATGNVRVHRHKIKVL